MQIIVNWTDRFFKNHQAEIMLRPTQTNKEFVDAAGIAEQDAFIAVAIRRIVAKMTEIPANEFTAEKDFDDLLLGKGFWTDWDEQLFLMEMEEAFNVDIELEKIERSIKQAAGDIHWFYTPCMTFGEWTRFVIDNLLAPFRDRISQPADWPGLESSDLESDAVAQNSPSHNVQFCISWGIIVIGGVIVVVAVLLRMI